MSQLETECLKLTKLWTPHEVISVRQAFSDASAGAVTLLKYYRGYPTPYRLDDWINLPIEDGEDFICTSRLHEIKKIAVPRVCICTSFDKIVAEEQKCTPDNLLKRYGHKDAVTGKALERKNFSREHVRPKSKGGKNGWENIVPMDRSLNSKRGNKSYRKLGLAKPKILGEPNKILPIHKIKNKAGYPEWDFHHISRA